MAALVDARRSTAPWRAVGVYVLVAHGGMWLLCLPFWLNGAGLQVVWATPLLVVAMWLPALASFLVCRFVTGEPWPSRVGLRIRRRASPGTAPAWGTVLRYAGAGVGVLAAFSLVVAVADAALGLRTDLSLDGYVARTLAALPAGTTVPAVVIKAGLVLNLLLGVLLLNPIAALGEEIGWRGWLFPALLPLGRVPAVVLTGLIWGLWHAPIMLLGYNYPQLPGWVAMLVFVLPCILLSAVLGWLRTASGSVLPCAYGHGAFNAFGGVVIAALPAAGENANAAVYGLFGAVGLVIAAAAIGITWSVNRRRGRGASAESGGIAGGTGPGAQS